MWWSITYKNVNEVLVGAVKWMKIPADSQSYCRGKTWHRVRTRAIVRECEPTLPGVRGRGPALSMRCACADAASGILQKKKGPFMHRVQSVSVHTHGPPRTRPRTESQTRTERNGERETVRESSEEDSSTHSVCRVKCLQSPRSAQSRLPDTQLGTSVKLDKDIQLPV